MLKRQDFVVESNANGTHTYDGVFAERTIYFRNEIKCVSPSRMHDIIPSTLLNHSSLAPPFALYRVCKS